MLIIQYRAHDILLQQLDEGNIGLSFVLKDKFDGDSAVFLPQQPRLVTQEGFLQIKYLELCVEGSNEVSEFSKKLHIRFKKVKRVNLDAEEGQADFFINIPEGEYSKLKFGIQLSDYGDLPSIQLAGTYISNDSDLIPVTLMVSGEWPRFDLELDAQQQTEFSSNSLINPGIVFEINAFRWFENLSREDFERADRDENGILIAPGQNQRLYGKIMEAVAFGKEISVELR